MKSQVASWIKSIATYFPALNTPFGFIFWAFVVYLAALLTSWLLTPIASEVLNMKDLSEKFARRDRNRFPQQPVIPETLEKKNG